MVVVVGLGRLPAQVPNRRERAAFELVIIIAVEDVVLAVILIVDHSLNIPQLPAQSLPRCAPSDPLAISVGRPAQERFRQLGGIFPRPTVDQRLQARAIGTGFGAKNAKAGLARGIGLIQAAGRQTRRFSLNAVGQGVVPLVSRPAQQRLLPPHQTSPSNRERHPGKSQKCASVTSTRGRFKTSRGKTSNPVTRPDVVSHCGFTPSNANA